MSSIGLTIEDEATRKANSQKVSRVLTFEDGIARHMTLTVRQWANYDALIDDGWTEEKMLWCAFDTAREFYESGEAPDFEAELRTCVQYLVDLTWRYHSSRIDRRPATTNFR